ncbi:Alpha-xylosidase [Leucoagaricus sp. SymC.cos]|nr:Alpha-xylosidase [Leucoagaricus sp. SymC.cos]
MAGCQRFPVHWGGDPMSTYEAMVETLRGSLSLGTSGFGYWVYDIGGFEGKLDPGLYKGWFAFGSLSSHSRLHGSGSYRVPWIIDTSGSYDPILHHFISLKLSLMPYLYGAAISTHCTGTPMMHPLFFEFPEDRTSWTIDEVYILGVNLYVAPVFSNSDLDPMGSGGYSPAGSSFAPEASGKKTEAKGRQSTMNEKASVQVYIPPGDWFSLLTGQFLTGVSWSIQHHTYDSLPLLLCPGCAIALSGGVPIDFYFNENGTWKLRDLDQTKIKEQAWSSDGE